MINQLATDPKKKSAILSIRAGYFISIEKCDGSQIWNSCKKKKNGRTEECGNSEQRPVEKAPHSERGPALPTCRNAFFCWALSGTSVSKNSNAATKGMRHNNNSPISSPHHVQKSTFANGHAPAPSFVAAAQPPPYFVYVRSVTPLTSVNTGVNTRDEILPFNGRPPRIGHAAASSRFLSRFRSKL